MNQPTVVDSVRIEDPKLRVLLERTASAVRLAATRVAAHDADPRRYPLPPDADALDRLLQSRFHALPTAQRHRAAARARDLLASPRLRRRHFGALASVSLTDARPIEALATEIALPSTLRLTHDDLVGFRERLLAPPATEPEIRPLLSWEAAQVRVHRIHCRDETDPEFFWTEDEIYLGAVTMDASGGLTMIQEFRVGTFEDGDTKVFDPPESIDKIDLTGGPWPRSAHVMFVLLEQDHSPLKFVSKLLELLRNFSKTISGIPFAIGEVLAFLLDKVVDLSLGWLEMLWEDDFFAPASSGLLVPSGNVTWDGSNESPPAKVKWKGHGGEYHMIFTWRLLHGAG